MTTIGLISDTHSYLDEQIFKHFADCDEIWHAGDIGSLEIIEKLQNFKPTRFVYGNIDSKEIQWEVPENQHFEIENLKVWMTHIGGIPPNYNSSLKKKLKELHPQLFVCGHSHILRVLKDEKLNNLIYINPGAAGKEGFHKIRTLLKMILDEGKIIKIDAIELGLRGK